MPKLSISLSLVGLMMCFGHVIMFEEGWRLGKAAICGIQIYKETFQSFQSFCHNEITIHNAAYNRLSTNKQIYLDYDQGDQKTGIVCRGGHCCLFSVSPDVWQTSTVYVPDGVFPVLEYIDGSPFFFIFGRRVGRCVRGSSRAAVLGVGRDNDSSSKSTNLADLCVLSLT